MGEDIYDHVDKKTLFVPLLYPSIEEKRKRAKFSKHEKYYVFNRKGQALVFKPAEKYGSKQKKVKF